MRGATYQLKPAAEPKPQNVRGYVKQIFLEIAVNVRMLVAGIFLYASIFISLQEYFFYQDNLS
jgi:hypothetical protein